jgi:hypothetical protein
MAADKVKETATGWLDGLAADFHDEKIVKLVQNHNWDYLEK